MIPVGNLIHHGFLGMGSQVWLNDPGIHSEHYTYWLPPLWFLPQAAWFKVFGYGLMQMRWHTIVWGAVLLVGLSRLGGQHGKWTGAWAALICALDYGFLNASDGRSDMVCSALGIWALVTGSEWLAAAACMTHPMGMLFAAVLTITKRRMYWPPYMLFFGLWGLYIAQQPVYAVEQWWGQITGHIREAQLVMGPGVYLLVGSGWRQLLLAVYVVCAGLSARRDWRLALCLLAFVFIPFFSSTVFYAAHWTPWLALCVAIQMRTHKWLCGILLLECIFAVTTLFPLWTWDGVFLLR